MTKPDSDLGIAANESEDSQPARKQNIWVELLPVMTFIISYNVMLRLPEGEGIFTKDYAIYWATGALMLVAFSVVAWLVVKGQKIPPFLLISTALIGVFGTIGIVWQNKLFLYVKPTIINLLYSAVIFGGLMVGRNVWKMLFDHIFDLPEKAWTVLAIRWGFYFIALAILNEVLWRNFSEATWANMKLANIPLTMLFMAANMPYTFKHLRSPMGEGASE